MALQNRNEQTGVKIAGNMVAAPIHFKLNRFAEIQKKSFTEK